MQSKVGSKKEHWQNHVKHWESSNLTQKSYCTQAGINLATFVYWRSRLGQPKIKQFASIAIQSPAVELSIKIKLVTGNIICIPHSVGIPEIAKLIHLLEMPNA